MFEPVRANHREGLLSLSYTAANMGAKPLTPQDVENTAEFLIETISQLNASPTLGERLRKDAKLLASEIIVTEPYPTLSFTFDHKGVESYTFGGPFPASLDGSEPLSILVHRGKQPIAVSASRTAKDPTGYDQAVKWIKIAFGYFEDFVVVQMPPDERTQYSHVMSFAVPFLTSIDAATRDHLIPSADGTQSLLLFDGRGELASLPGIERLPQPLAIPRLGAAVELNDAAEFKLAMQGYVDAARKLIADIQIAHPSAMPPGFEIASPNTSETEGGTLYFYPLPVELGADVAPCALFKGNLLVLASSLRLAEQMAGEQVLPNCPVTGIDKAAGSVTIIEFDELWDFLRRLSSSGFTLAHEANRGMDPQMVNMIKIHVDATLRSAGALRSYHSTTTQQNGRAVQHSWLHVEDISR